MTSLAVFTLFNYWATVYCRMMRFATTNQAVVQPKTDILGFV